MFKISFNIHYFYYSSFLGLSQKRISIIEKKVEELFPELIELRRGLHKNPELSNHEYKTSKFIAEYLQRLGLKVYDIEIQLVFFVIKQTYVIFARI